MYLRNQKIWYQNRRSNTRRKSRPVGSHDLSTMLHSEGSDVSEQSTSSQDTVASSTGSEAVEASNKDEQNISKSPSSEVNLSKSTVVVEETQTTIIESFKS